MDISTKIYSLQEIKNILNNMNLPKDVEKIYLFGSYAKELANEKSDIDLYIKYNPERKGIACYGLMIPLQEAFSKKIDLVTKYDLDGNPLLKKFINQCGRIVYERCTLVNDVRPF